MAKKEQKATIVVLKGNKEVVGNGIKANAMGVILKFTAQAVKGCDFLSDACTYMLDMPVVEGDLKWMQENVLKYVDILGASNDAEIQRKADKMYEMYVEKGGVTKEAAGLSLIRSYLQQYYLIEKSASIFIR